MWRDLFRRVCKNLRLARTKCTMVPEFPASSLHFSVSMRSFLEFALGIPSQSRTPASAFLLRLWLGLVLELVLGTLPSQQLVEVPCG